MDFRAVREIQNLLFDVGCHHKIKHLSLCQNGGNNKSYFVEVEDERFFAKFYFPDTRQRLEREWKFIKYAVSHGINCVPRPIGCNPDKNLAIYEFIDGQKPSERDVGLSDVKQASNFFKALNIPDVTVDRSLPIASEACFKISDHFSIIETRLLRLNSIKSLYSCQHNFYKFVENLSSQWKMLKKTLLYRKFQKNQSVPDELNRNFWRISPSDFGFHNSIRQPDGTLYFIDFEYGGWDDPCKMIVDFFLQPAILINPEYYEFFLSDILNNFCNSKEIVDRVQILYPLLAFKWSCIVLNCFIPEWVEINIFSNSKKNLEELKMDRLKKAENYLEQAISMVDKLN